MGTPRLRFCAAPSIGYTSPNVYARTSFDSSEGHTGDGFTADWQGCPAGNATGSTCTSWDAFSPTSGGLFSPGGNNAPEGNASSRSRFGDQVNTSANHSGGVGGRGLRHWRGDRKADGTLATNQNGGGVVINIPGDPTEIWLRYYCRYEAGFAWDAIGTNAKDIYINTSPGLTGCRFYFGYHNGNLGGYAESDTTLNLESSTTWNTVMGGAGSDGQWHCYEIHAALGTVNNFDGLWEIWLDGVLKESISNVRFAQTGQTTGFSLFRLGSNNHQPNNSTAGTPYGLAMYVDYDDIVVADSYIGPYNATRGY